MNFSFILNLMSGPTPTTLITKFRLEENSVHEDFRMIHKKSSKLFVNTSARDLKVGTFYHEDDQFYKYG